MAISLLLSPLAAETHADVDRTMAPGDREALEALATMAPASLAALAAALTPQAIAAERAALLAVGSRMLGTRAEDGAALDRFLAERLRVAGWSDQIAVGHPVVVPVDEGTTLTVGDERLTLHPLWPNGPIPAQAPLAGLTAPLVDVGAATWKDLAGKPLAGRIALMDFRGGRAWERLADLGARAVVVLHDDFVNTANAYGLCYSLPVPFARFYAGPAEAARLRALAGAGASATVRGGAVWKPCPAITRFAYLPPSQAGDGDAPVLALAVAVDSTSVAPSAPHGQASADNLAVALAVARALAAGDTPRRRGIVLALLDGETMGGQGSQLVVDLLGVNGEDARARQLRARSEAEAAEALATATAVVRDVLAGRAPADRLADLGDAIAGIAELLERRCESRRVALAEARIAAKNAGDRAAQAAHERALAAAVALRGRLRPQSEAIAAFVAALGRNGEPSAEAQLAGIDRDRLAGELATLAATRAAHAGALRQRVAAGDWLTSLGKPAAVAAALRRGEPPAERLRHGIDLALLADLSQGGHGFTSALQMLARENASLYAYDGAIDDKWRQAFEVRGEQMLAVASRRAGWTVEKRIVPTTGNKQDPTYPVDLPKSPVFTYHWAGVGVTALGLATVNDARSLLDCPADVAPAAGGGGDANLAVQAQSLAVLLRVLAESAIYGAAPGKVTRATWGRLAGRTLRFNIRSGTEPREPVPDAVVLPRLSVAKTETSNAQCTFGVRTRPVLLSDSDGAFIVPWDPVKTKETKGKEVHAYVLDRANASIALCSDRGQTGTLKPDPAYALAESGSVKRVVLTPAVPLAFFPGVTANGYLPLETLQPIDAVRNGSPQHYGRYSPKDLAEKDIAAQVVFMPAGSRVKLVFSTKEEKQLLLINGAEGDDPKGSGYPVAAGAPVLDHAARRGAADALRLLDDRIATFARFGIADRQVDADHALARRKLAEAVAAEQADDHQRAVGLARESWGMAMTVYPRVTALGRHAIASVMILMFLLVPAAWFVQGLALKGRSIVGRLVGAGAVFAVGVLFLNWLHPAFRISVNPLIVVISFLMIFMAVVVLVLSYGRFERLMRRWRSSAGMVEAEEIAAGSALAIAFNLGVANLRKRRVRTFLTALTVVALTFSITAFVSVSGQPALNVTPIPSAGPAPYRGLLFREYQWRTMQETALDALASEYPDHLVVRRGWFQQKEGGYNVERQNNLKVERVDRPGKPPAWSAVAAMTFDPAEPKVTGIDRALAAGRWFKEGEQRVAIVPSACAQALGITAADLERPEGERPRVRLRGATFTVIGILDTAKADALRDVGGKSPALVDFVASAIAPRDVGDLANEPPTIHQSFDAAVLVPTLAGKLIDAKAKAAVLLLPDGTDERAFYRAMLARHSKVELIASIDGGSAFVAKATDSAVQGLAKVLVPVILCILIVFNTMMGAVEERRGEIAMLGAVGLSPGQISSLLLSEATVFSVLGIVGGIMLGLAFSALCSATGLLSTLSFNFTSLVSMTAALAVGGVVLLATWLPARQAAALAAPSGMARWKLPDPGADGGLDFALPFTLTRGNAVGMVAFLADFLNAHADPTSADFNARNLRARQERSPDALALAADLWLAPYDLDVAQRLSVRVAPSDEEGVFRVALRLERSGGSEEAWLRLNYRFLDLVRHQFLVWRNVDDATRRRYIERGVALFSSSASVVHRATEPVHA